MIHIIIHNIIHILIHGVIKVRYTHPSSALDTMVYGGLSINEAISWASFNAAALTSFDDFLPIL